MNSMTERFIRAFCKGVAVSCLLACVGAVTFLAGILLAKLLWSLS